MQTEYNERNGIVPHTVRKEIRDLIEIGITDRNEITNDTKNDKRPKKMSKNEREKLIESLSSEMREAAKHLEFERAAFLRDKIRSLQEEK